MSSINERRVAALIGCAIAMAVMSASADAQTVIRIGGDIAARITVLPKIDPKQGAHVVHLSLEWRK